MGTTTPVSGGEETIGERIRARRKELGISQRGLSAKGMSSAYVSRIEAGDRRPSIRALRLIAGKLQTTTHWLETGEDDPSVELAELVLAHKTGTMSKRAVTLARRMVERG